MRSSTEKLLFLSIFSVLIIIALIIGSYFYNFSGGPSVKQDVWGQFGDYIGGVLNPFLSFSALAALLVTIKIQLSESVKTEKKYSADTFESRFFQLVNLQHTSALSVHFEDGRNSADNKVKFEGHRGVAYAWNRLDEDYFRFVEQTPDSQHVYAQAKAKFSDWRRSYWTGVASYFESTVYIIEFVTQQVSDEESVRFYLKTVLSQLSPEERALLFYVMIFENRFKLFEFLSNHKFWALSVDESLFHSKKQLIAILIASNLATNKDEAEAQSVS